MGLNVLYIAICLCTFKLLITTCTSLAKKLDLKWYIFLQRNIYICVKLLIPNGTKVVECPLLKKNVCCLPTHVPTPNILLQFLANIYFTVQCWTKFITNKIFEAAMNRSHFLPSTIWHSSACSSLHLCWKCRAVPLLLHTYTCIFI
jgi:hypothetical protein